MRPECTGHAAPFPGMEAYGWAGLGSEAGVWMCQNYSDPAVTSRLPSPSKSESPGQGTDVGGRGLSLHLTHTQGRLLCCSWGTLHKAGNILGPEATASGMTCGFLGLSLWASDHLCCGVESEEIFMICMSPIFPCF